MIPPGHWKDQILFPPVQRFPRHLSYQKTESCCLKRDILPSFPLRCCETTLHIFDVQARDHFPYITRGTVQTERNSKNGTCPMRELSAATECFVSQCFPASEEKVSQERPHQLSQHQTSTCVMNFSQL
ncbi:hypothetical protein RvY_15237 [Ramazzottius varieornatus]|uniref:Uncharacterized protein n=1 Tax=Ramazzottius varieornatus TaxID=947166 RepID=A0A1D1W2A2_RAMVA|nr:hypothetical protein RvY_15237 [Ramazzottius varieornatus]